MSTNFPTSLDTTTELANDATATKGQGEALAHSSRHNNDADAILALEAKVGADSSAVTTSLDYKVKNPASSDPGHVHTAASVSGVIESGDAAGGDLGGTYPNPTVTDDSHAHTGATVTGVVKSGDAAGGDLGGTYPNPTVTDDSHAHTGTTLSAIAETAITDGTLLARVGSAETITGAWTFNAGKLLDKGEIVYDVKAYGALGDNATDDTTAIQAAIDAANAAGGGVVFFPKGTYISTLLTIYSNLQLIGVGTQASVIKLKNTTNTALIRGYDWVALSAGDTTGGIHSWSIRNMGLDGNKANNLTNGTGIQVYGYHYVLEDVEVYSFRESGISSMWSSSSPPPGPNGIGMEAKYLRVASHDNEVDGVTFSGPHDSHFTDCLFYYNTAKGFHANSTSKANAVNLSSCHAYGNSQTYGFYLLSDGANLNSCTAEGAATAQVHIGANNTFINRCYIFAAGAATPVGIEIATTVSGYNISGTILNCTSGSVKFGASDGGIGEIDILVYQASGAVFNGTPAATTDYRVTVSGGATGGAFRFLSDVTMPTISGDVWMTGNVRFDGNNWIQFSNGGTVYIRIQNPDGAIVWPRGGANKDCSLSPSADDYLHTPNNLSIDKTFNVGQSASAPAIATNGTVTTAGVAEARLAPAGAVTGIILQAGTTAGQMCMVVNQSAAANTVTFAASGTSNVADGTGSVIAGLTARLFIWNSATSLWYPCK